MRQFKTIIPMPRSGIVSLRAALVGAVLLPFLTATAMTAWYSVDYLEERTESRMQEDIELVARAIRLPLSHALERGYERTVQRALDSAFSIDRVFGVYVYDRDGHPLARSGTRDAPIGTDRAARIASRGETQGEFRQAGSEEVFSYFVPLPDSGGRIAGLLQVTRHGSDFDSYIQSVRTHTLTVVALSGFSLVLIIFFGHRWTVGRHLSAIEDGLGRIRNGDLNHRLPLRGPRELRMLAAAVNRMASAILLSRKELSEQQQREAELEERLHQSEKMAAVGQLAAGVAHELGSPLSTIDGKAQRLLRKDDLSQPVAAAMHTIRGEAGRMERIIRQLLDFGRSNPLHRRRMPADKPLQTALRQAASEAAERGIRIVFDKPPEVPEIAVDSIRLQQALGNLINNAQQVARTTVRVGLERYTDAVHYVVDDDGPGIPPELHAQIFEPFFTTKRVGEGTGLGLAVAHAAARDHGGRINVEESASGGARLRLILPLTDKEAAQ
ncbi:ATP-binding protein [Thiohalomonas denitrificans]|uniref:histidine kinase n=1 Tax=Thiohalomonas denitrificans TaxID=415747 RepID=A0A1G5Q3V8_9GAMM|nr:ATP-binding protein [Thiohalomonas denitrificans]SCZ56236.1 HAMP domain-containing protein [Thiohalomonas denitrificans]